MRRRAQEQFEGKFDWASVFKGEGVDVGSGDDPLERCPVSIENSFKAMSFDLPDGAGDDLRDRSGAAIRFHSRVERA